MSFELGMALTVLAVAGAMACFVLYLYVSYRQRKHYYTYLKYRGRVRDIRAEQAYADIEAAIWDSCRINANYIIKELKR